MESTQDNHLITGRDQTATCTLLPGPQPCAPTHLAFAEDSSSKAPVLGDWGSGWSSGFSFLGLIICFYLLSVNISVNESGHLMRQLLKSSTDFYLLITYNIKVNKVIAGPKPLLGAGSPSSSLCNTFMLKTHLPINSVRITTRQKCHGVYTPASQLMPAAALTLKYIKKIIK